MHILFINQFYWPEMAPTSVLLTDLTRELSRQGHRITVMCGSGGYAADIASEKPSVEIIRLPTAAFKRTKGARLLSWATFLASATFVSLSRRPPDLVVTMTTPPFCSLIGALLKIVGRTKHCIWEMDMYPDVAVDVGAMSATSAATRIMGMLADLGRKHSDLVIALSKCMYDRLRLRGVPADKLRIAENWAEALPHFDRSGRAFTHPFTAIYTGNLGLAHDHQTLAQVLRVLKNDSRFRFQFTGGGERVQWLKTLCENELICNVDFFPYLSRLELLNVVANADVGVVTQVEATVGSVVPSKFYFLAAAGLPVFYIGAKEALPACMIREYGCGWFAQVGDVQAICRELLKLEADRTLARNAGQRIHAAFEKHWNRTVSVERLMSCLGLGFSAPCGEAPGSPLVDCTLN